MRPASSSCNPAGELLLWRRRRGNRCALFCLGPREGWSGPLRAHAPAVSSASSPSTWAALRPMCLWLKATSLLPATRKLPDSPSAFPCSTYILWAPAEGHWLASTPVEFCGSDRNRRVPTLALSAMAGARSPRFPMPTFFSDACSPGNFSAEILFLILIAPGGSHRSG